MELAPFLAFAAAAVAALAGGIVLVVRKHRATGIGLILVGSFLVLLPVGIYVMFFTPISDPTSMQVEGFDPEHDSGFTVAMRHQQDFWTESAVSFRKVGGAEAVAEIFEDQHPDGVVTATTSPADSDGSASIWHLSTDDSRFDVVTGVSEDWYALITQFAVVDPVDGGPLVRVPFPRSDPGGIEFREGTAYSNGWSNEQWLDFYADISGASASGDTITVPTNRGGTATITLDQGTATVAVNPQPH